MRKKIYLEEVNGILKFHFLNGDLEISEYDYGAYSIASGCGSGKTTLIRELIKLKWSEGVLYSAFTIEEVNSMYQWIKENMIDTGIISMDDIIVLHSDYRSEGTDNNLWRNNPEELMNKRIILCTHYKLLNEPIDLMIASSFNDQLGKDMNSPIFNSGVGIGSYPRQWILIDENIELNIRYYNILVNSLSLLGKLEVTERRVTDKGRYETVDIEPKFVRSDIFYKDFINKIYSMSKYMGYNLLDINPNESKINKIKFDQIAHCIFYKFEEYYKIAKEKNHVKVSFNFSDIIFPGIKFHLLLLDGTSDITLSGGNKFRVLTYDNKYTGDINLSLIPFNIDRKIKNSLDIDNYDSYIRKELDNYIDSLSEVIKSNTQTLIFCWKNFKIDNSEINDDIDEFSGNIIEESRELILNKNFSLPSYIKTKLEERGFIEGKEFSIEYYGSGRDKAINDYRDYDAVVLLGKYQVPNSVIGEFNMVYGSNIGRLEYYSNRVIQAICRTRIRLHDNNKSLNIYMSSDWSGDIIGYVKSYLGISKINRLDTNANLETINKYYNILRSINITPKKAENISKIGLLDENIIISLVNRTCYETQLKLNDMYSVLPMSRKDSNKYRNIVRYLKENNVTLNIV